jgi:hypothetical protein
LLICNLERLCPCGTHAITAASTTTASTTTATSAARESALGGLAAGAFATANCATIGSCLRLASELDGDLAVEDVLAVQLADGTLGLRWRGEVDKGIADWASGARVDRDGDTFAVDLSVYQ